MSQNEILEMLALPPYHLEAIQSLRRETKMSVQEILRNAIGTDFMYRAIDAVTIADYRRAPNGGY